MILQTGGRSLGATSTRSSPASRAASRALLVGMTPSMAPSALMTRTGEMRICSLTLKPLSIGPIASSSGTRNRKRPAGERAASTSVLESPAPGQKPTRPAPGQPSIVAGQTYDLRFHERVVKVAFHRFNARIPPAFCPATCVERAGPVIFGGGAEEA